MNAQEESPSTKREAWLAIGKARVRIPADLHRSLIRYSTAHRYEKAFSALLYAADVGLRVLNARGQVYEIPVEKGDRQ